MDILFLCIKIFLVRIIDVSLGTARTIIMVKGKSLVASLIGFVEVFVWFVIAREALNTTESSLLILPGSDEAGNTEHCLNHEQLPAERQPDVFLVFSAC